MPVTGLFFDTDPAGEEWTGEYAGCLRVAKYPSLVQGAGIFYYEGKRDSYVVKPPHDPDGEDTLQVNWDAWLVAHEMGADHVVAYLTDVQGMVVAPAEEVNKAEVEMMGEYLWAFVPIHECTTWGGADPHPEEAIRRHVDVYPYLQDNELDHRPQQNRDEHTQQPTLFD